MYVCVFMYMVRCLRILKPEVDRYLPLLLSTLCLRLGALAEHRILPPGSRASQLALGSLLSLPPVLGLSVGCQNHHLFTWGLGF